MDTDAVQVDTWVTLAEAAGLLGRSEKTLRRMIASGDLDSAAVRKEKTPTGFRYMLRLDAVEKAKGAMALVPTAKVDSTLSTLPGKVDTLTAELARVSSMIAALQGGIAVHVDSRVQAAEETLTARLDQVDSNAVQGQEQQTKAQQDQAASLETLRELVEAQGAELAAMRADLQAERERQEAAQRASWWRRAFGGSRER